MNTLKGQWLPNPGASYDEGGEHTTDLSITQNQSYGWIKSHKLKQTTQNFSNMEQTQNAKFITQNYKWKKKMSCLHWCRFLVSKFPIFQVLFFWTPPERCTDCRLQRCLQCFRDITFMFCNNPNQSVPPVATGQIPDNPILLSSCFLRTDVLSLH